MRADDGVGPYIFSQLDGCPGLRVINAAYTPENIIEDVIELQPKKILFIDAADFGGTPGEIRNIDKDHIPESSISTHGISLRVIASIIEEDTGAHIVFIGIQPKSVGFGEGLSTEVKQAADELIGCITKEG